MRPEIWYHRGVLVVMHVLMLHVGQRVCSKNSFFPYEMTVKALNPIGQECLWSGTWPLLLFSLQECRGAGSQADGMPEITYII